MKPEYWDQACKYLSKQDPTLAQIIKRNQHKHLSSKGNAFETLAHAIVGQQISSKAAESIWAKFISLFKSKKPSATSFLKLSSKKLKSIGLSEQKIGYIRGIADFLVSHKITAKYFKNNPNIHQELLAIRGVGPWTLEMFRIFYLLEADVFPAKDLGIHKAIQKYYPKIQIKNLDDLIKFSERWQPYRTVAIWHLWSSFDADPIAY